jgi:hypothetical protein
MSKRHSDLISIENKGIAQNVKIIIIILHRLRNHHPQNLLNTIKFIRTLDEIIISEELVCNLKPANAVRVTKS